MTFLIALISILSLTFLLRGSYRLLVPSGLAISGDAVVHLIITGGIRRNGHRIPDQFPEFLLGGPHNYPSFFHWLLSFLPRNTLEKWEPFIGTLIEMIHNGFIFVSATLLAFAQGSTNPIWVGFIASLIFALTPLFIEHVGRVFLLSERPFGSFLGTVFVFFGLQYHISSDLRFLAGATVTAAVIFISSKFTVQAILFVSFIFSLLSWKAKLWLPIGGGLLLVTLISRGYALRILAGHVRHSFFYHKFLLNKYVRPTSQYKEILTSFIKGIRYPSSLIQVFRTNCVLKLFSMVPWTMVLFALVFREGVVTKSNPFLRVCLLWTISSVIVMGIISLKPMRFLGEPERYLEISILPLAFLTAYLLIQANSLFLWGLFFLITFYASIVFFFLFAEASKLCLWDSDQEDVCRWLHEVEPSRILTIPVKAVCFLVYRTQHQGLSILTNISEPSQQRRFRELCPILYPFPNANLEGLAKQYDLGFIIAHKPTLNSLDRNKLGIKYDFSRFQKRYENRSFVVYGVGLDL